VEEDEEDVEYSSECQTGHPGGNRCSDLCSGGQGHEEVLVDIQHPGRRPSLRLGIESSSSSSLLMTSHSDCLMKTEPLLLPITPTPADSRTGALQTKRRRLSLSSLFLAFVFPPFLPPRNDPPPPPFFHPLGQSTLLRKTPAAAAATVAAAVKAEHILIISGVKCGEASAIA
jgi:hypothetical protein